MSEKKPKKETKTTMRSRYDFNEGSLRKAAEEYRKKASVVELAPDVAAEFKTSDAVNKALRKVARKRRGGGA